MSVKFPKKYYSVFTIIALITAVVVYWVASHIVDIEENARIKRLEQVNAEAATEFKESLNTYATLLSGIKTFIELHNRTPDKDLIQNFLKNQLQGLSTDPPFSISYIDTNHIFQFDITMDSKTSIPLKGTSIQTFIGMEGIKRMDTLMQKNLFYASNPTNLFEGDVGLPLGFGVLNDKNISIGYITAVTEMVPLFKRIYKNIDKEEFVFKFKSSSGMYFDHIRSYNDQAMYSTQKNPEYFKNFDIPKEAYINTKVPFYNKEFIISTAYKHRFKSSPTIFVTSFIWYIAIIGFMFFLISQYYMYENKNKIIDEQKKQLSELVATKNKFFSIIAHDLRSPISSVICSLDMLKDESFKSPETNFIIDSLGNSSKNSLALLDNLS